MTDIPMTDNQPATPYYPLSHAARERGLTDADVRPGLPATILIGSDRYASAVEHVTPKSVVAKLHGESLRFVKTKRRGWCAQGSYRITLGEADDYRDPSF